MASGGAATSGGAQPALGWTVGLAFGGMVAAGMQGLLAAESAAPCRLSHTKWRVLCALAAVQVALQFAAALGACVRLELATAAGALSWLRWLAPTLLAVGLAEQVLDMWLTLRLGVRSRLHWAPFAAVRSARGGSVSVRATSTLRTLSVAFAFLATLVLIGWRQRWWLDGVRVAVGQTAANSSVALSVGIIGLCATWCVCLAVGVLGYVVYQEAMLVRDGYASLFHEVLGARRPARFLSRRAVAGMRVRGDDISESHRELYAVAYRVSHGSQYTHGLSCDEVNANLSVAPLHVGNAVVGPDVNAVQVDDAVWGGGGKLIGFVEHFTLLPILACVLAGVAQLHASLDDATYCALAELVDMSLVVTLGEASTALKIALWSFGGQPWRMHMNDRTADAPSNRREEGGFETCDVTNEFEHLSDTTRSGGASSTVRSESEEGNAEAEAVV